MPKRLQESRDLRQWLARPAVAAATCAVVALILYGPAIFHEFTYDDVSIVANDTRLDEPLFGLEVWVSPWWKNGSAMMESRPLVTFTFWLQSQIHGKIPMPFMAVNIVLFAILSAQVALLSWRWIGHAWGGWAAGLLFAAHPIHVEVVANVVGRAETLSAIFVVLAMQLWLRWRDNLTNRRAVLIGVTILLAGLSKESGYLVAPMLGVIEIAWRRKEHRPILDKPIPWNFVVVVMIVAGLAITQRTVMRDIGGANHRIVMVSDIDNPLMTASATERICTPVKVVGQIGRLILMPVDVDRTEPLPQDDPALEHPGARAAAKAMSPNTWRFWDWRWYSAQSPDYSPRMLMPTNHLGEPLSLLGLACLLVWGGLTIWTWRKRSPILGALLAMPIAWAIPSNTFLLIGTIFGERLTTQLTLFLPIAIVGLIPFDRLTRRGVWAAAVGLAIVVWGLGVATQNYRSVWSAGDNLNVYMVNRHPLSGRFQAFMARRLMAFGLAIPEKRKDFFEYAEYHADLADEYWPRQAIANMVRGVIAYERGDLVTAKKLLTLAAQWDSSLGLAEEYLAKIEGGPTLEELKKRRAQLEAQLEKDPDNRQDKRALAMVLVKLKKPGGAIKYFEELCTPESDDVELLAAYADALLLLNRFGSAADIYVHRIRLEPGRWDLYSDGAIVATYAGGTHLKIAKQWAEEAVRLNPDAPEAWMALGQWYQTSGDPTSAEKYYREGIRRAPPDDPKRSHYQLMLERLLSTDKTRTKAP
ncbi:MAG: tetratricopeptide repeat protein [Phycisphaera sp.]|nr:tetratricopeptide repeat protein [Phycisphaera sp.]